MRYKIPILCTGYMGFLNSVKNFLRFYNPRRSQKDVFDHLSGIPGLVFPINRLIKRFYSSTSCANALLNLDVPGKDFGNILKKPTNRPDTGESYGY